MLCEAGEQADPMGAHAGPQPCRLNGRERLVGLVRAGASYSLWARMRAPSPEG